MTKSGYSYDVSELFFLSAHVPVNSLDIHCYATFAQADVHGDYYKEKKKERKIR